MDLYLIAHKVRGESAFDIAERMRCPICEPIMQGLDSGTVSNSCNDCDGEGFWWIIPTSGHRAYPYSSIGLYDINLEQWLSLKKDMPEGWPDHYPTRSSPKAEPSSGKLLLAQLGLIPKVVRRL